LVANVNGWLVPLVGTANNGLSNRITLPAPPSTGAQTNFVFLEVWQAQVAPNPSTINKPSASTLYYMGNVESGVAGISDDLEDPTIGFETTERTQIQYRFRVVASVDAATYPDGLEDPLITGQGTGTTPGLFTFTNMASENGDVSCWRAGNGNPNNALGTVDGYVYAIPVCLVFRRNSTDFTAIDPTTPNQNGALNRNLLSQTLPNSRTGAKRYTEAVLTSSLALGATGAVSITGITDTMFGDTVFAASVDPSNTVYVTLTSGIYREVVEIEDVDLVGGTITITRRGCAGTADTFWPAGTVAALYNTRYDGVYADQITAEDILDLRRLPVERINASALLETGLREILSGKLATTWKESATGSVSAGSTVLEVDYFSGTPLTDTISVDAPDGLRQTFSAAVHTERGLLMLDPNQVDGTTGVATNFANGLLSIQAPITTSGFIPNPATPGWKDGSVIILDDAAIKPGARLLTPAEEWQSYYKSVGPQSPVSIQFLGEPSTYKPFGATTALSYPTTKEVFDTLTELSDVTGPLVPCDQNRSLPFMLLGDVVNANFASITIDATDIDTSVDGIFEVDLGVNFDDAIYGLGTALDLDLSLIQEPLLDGSRSLWGMITNDGKDLTGYSSELYLVIYGDASIAGQQNNGVFRVIGAGTKYGDVATANTNVKVQAVSRGFTATAPLSGETGLTAEIRCPYTTMANTYPPMVVLTDLASTLNPFAQSVTAPVDAPMLLRVTAVYEGNHGLSQVANSIDAVVVDNFGSATLLREELDEIDATFTNSGEFPDNQIPYDPQILRTWAKFPDKGHQAENGRDGEVFVDGNSRTVVMRPYQAAQVHAITMLADVGRKILPTNYAGGTTRIDGAAVFQANPIADGTSTTEYALPIPEELLPAFGRQDIPYNYGNGSFLPGINHLFYDTNTNTDDIYRVIGGPTSVTSSIRSMLGWTSTSNYGDYDNISTGATSGYVCRKITLRSEISTQTGNLLRGIELPPFIGIARLYGVYERANYLVTESVFVPGGFQSNRVTPRVGGPTNLLRAGANRQTLFIHKNGADANTGFEDSHTYVIPENVIDLNLISGFDPTSEDFSTYDYVVEFVYFGFTPGFINRNSLVLIRRTNAQNVTVNNTSLVTPLSLDLNMVVPWALPNDATFYATYRRRVYQGDPYHTRGASLNYSEVPRRYGYADQSDTFELATIAQQFSDAGTSDIELPLLRPLRVLASTDFVTTLGTGRLTTSLYAAQTEPGYMDGPVIPDAATGLWRLPHNRALTAKVGKDSAKITIQVIDYTDLVDTSSTNTGDEFTGSFRFVFKDTYYDTTFPVSTGSYLTVTSNEEMAEALYRAMVEDPLVMNLFYVEQVGTTITLYSYEAGEYGNLVQVVLTPRGTTTPMVLAKALTILYESPKFNAANARYLAVESLPGSSQGSFSGGSNHPSLPVVSIPQTYAGAVSRLPLGAAFTESDFIGESVNGSLLTIGPVRDSASLLGEEGRYLLQSESETDPSNYQPWNGGSGTKKFRAMRGSSLSTLDGIKAKPISWSAGESDHDYKGAVLVGRAYLVQNQYEDMPTGEIRSHGGELQVVIATSACFRDLHGEIGAIGYGEGYAAADRYLLTGRPTALLTSTCTTSMDDVIAEAFIQETEAEEQECVCP
jgi:hypothetical protein